MSQLELPMVAEATPRVAAPARSQALRRFRRNRAAVVGVGILLLLIILAVFAGPIGMTSPLTVHPAQASQPPSWAHILGTDLEGRDVWSRTVHGAQASLLIGFGSVALSTLIGAPLGLLAGYFRGWVDAVIMRFTDVVLSFPVIVFLIVAGSVFGTGIVQLILLLSMVNWPTITRLVRAQAMEQRETDYVMAARTVGCSDWRILVRHIAPSTLGVTAVTATFGVAYVVLVEASLSFLGVGVQPPTPTWGNMLTDAQTLTVLESMPWLWIPPTVMIFATIMAINFIGDGLRDAVDPRGGRS